MARPMPLAAVVLVLGTRLSKQGPKAQVLQGQAVLLLLSEKHFLQEHLPCVEIMDEKPKSLRVSMPNGPGAPNKSPLCLVCLDMSSDYATLS